MENILVVCVGNICRSVIGKRMLRTQLPDRFTVESAGIGALVGHASDKDASAVAAEREVSPDGYVARQFSRETGQEYGLILALEPSHVMLLDQWTGATGIAAPYRKGRTFHEQAFVQVFKATSQWVRRLSPGLGWP